MSKYGKYTGGQIESVLNMIGGEPIIDDLLTGRVKIVVVPVARKEVAPRVQVCQVFGSNRCTICGGFFGDGDDICSSGHQIGQHYEKAV